MIKALWLIITGKVSSDKVHKLAEGTHFLSAYGNRGGKRKAAGTVKAGVKTIEASEGQVTDGH